MALQIFRANQHPFEVTIVTVDQIVWFEGSEVAACLEYANPQKALRDHIDEEGREIWEDLCGVYGRGEIVHPF